MPTSKANFQRILKKYGTDQSVKVAPALSASFLIDQGRATAVLGYDDDPLRGGPMVFGFEPIARSDYGHASLKRSADAGLWLVR
ncbi:hypothetical protein [Janthinobacterium tructae]|uniref:Uncharacterized protein n=1 Tax=Janthinobacterium tructae TaxID=2590869 RepID=A0A4Y6RBA1_9BURK|nr:hypothetical protein [Janthinobacterium tructae]QDG70143.1 hypothetical protein FJQ89_06700 [Janthinobacterium tructae]